MRSTGWTLLGLCLALLMPLAGCAVIEKVWDEVSSQRQNAATRAVIEQECAAIRQQIQASMAATLRAVAEEADRDEEELAADYTDCTD